MEKIVKIYDHDKLFDEVMEHYELDTNNGWLLNSNHYGHEEICRLIDKKTGHRVGWYIFEQFFDDAGKIITQAYITIARD